jgi:heme exporter protein C
MGAAGVGVYWTWEPRLTISALQLNRLPCLRMLRRLAEGDPARVARLSAVYGILAFATVPLSWFAIRWWRTIHPNIIGAGGEMALAPRMVQALLAAIVAQTLTYATLVRQRIRLARAEERFAWLRARAMADEEDQAWYEHR